jgi:type II secretory pathway pseudopilin PulG
VFGLDTSVAESPRLLRFLYAWHIKQPENGRETARKTSIDTQKDEQRQKQNNAVIEAQIMAKFILSMRAKPDTGYGKGLYKCTAQRKQGNKGDGKRGAVVGSLVASASSAPNNPKHSNVPFTVVTTGKPNRGADLSYYLQVGHSQCGAPRMIR